jgi:type IV secretory pathway VirJ component
VIAAAALSLAVATSTVATSRGEQPMSVYAPAAQADKAAAKPLVLVLSGEGGWRSFDDRLATWLAAAGYWVGGIDCLKYFWKPQDDRAALASDVMMYADALTRSAGRSGKPPIVLAGFSFGADLAPWIAGVKGGSHEIAALLMIGPDLRGSLEARVIEILGYVPKQHIFDTAAALAESRSIPVLFVHGGNDDDSAAPALAAAFTGPKKLAVVPGATHHFAGHVDELRHAVIDGLELLLSK